MTGDRGSTTIETAILLPVFAALIVLAIVQGRAQIALTAVEFAAYDAARTASLAGDASTARSRAIDAARQSLAQQGLACVGGPQVSVDVSQYARPVGQPASVTATVTCTVSYADIDAIPGVPSGRTLTASFTSPLDQYRSRS